jgi:hypothetical protein
MKEGDRGKPRGLDAPSCEAVVNQRLHACSEMMSNPTLWFHHLRVRCVHSIVNAANPAEGVREPARQEFNLGSAVDANCFDQLRSTSLACGVMSE